MIPRKQAMTASIVALALHLVAASLGTRSFAIADKEWKIVFVVLPPLVDILSIIIFCSHTYTRAVSVHFVIALIVYLAVQVASHIFLLLSVINEFKKSAECTGDTCKMGKNINIILAVVLGVSALLAGVTGFFAFKALRAARQEAYQTLA